jgi:hypothetical protein
VLKGEGPSDPHRRLELGLIATDLVYVCDVTLSRWQVDRSVKRSNQTDAPTDLYNISVPIQTEYLIFQPIDLSNHIHCYYIYIRTQVPQLQLVLEYLGASLQARKY